MAELEGELHGAPRQRSRQSVRPRRNLRRLDRKRRGRDPPAASRS